jgi:hypothetical protein
MSIRRVKIVLLCEDSQHEAFVRRFLNGMGWNTREIRVEKSPTAGGSAEQWVRQTFPEELRIYQQRKQRAASALIVIIDADTYTVQQRINELQHECGLKQIPFRGSNDTVAFVVPKRNIETWIHFLNGHPVNEEDPYAKYDNERECQSAVNILVGLCKSSGLTAEAPPSLKAACNEYMSRIKILA